MKRTSVYVCFFCLIITYFEREAKVGWILNFRTQGSVTAAFFWCQNKSER